MTTAPSSRRLGRGLAALMGDSRSPSSVAVAPQDRLSSERGDHDRRASEGVDVASSRRVPVTWLEPHAGQPRDIFANEPLQELADSIRVHGVIQPLIVRPIEGVSNRFTIIAGERRWRAAQAAGLHDVPVIVRILTDREALEIALIENVQRENLSVLEEARGYRALIEQCGHTQEVLAQTVGKSRPHIANLLRLLKLPDELQRMLEDGRITAGHARAIANCVDPITLAYKIEREGLSVRQAEALAQETVKERARDRLNTSMHGSQPLVEVSSRFSGDGANADHAALVRDLEDITGLRVRLKVSGTAGSVTFLYHDLDQLDGLLVRLRVGRQSP